MAIQKLPRYTVSEAAELLGMGRSTLYRAIHDKQVPYRLLPGTNKMFFIDADIEQIIADAYRPAA